MAKLRKEKLSDILPRLEAIQQDNSRINAEIPGMIREEVGKAIKINVNGKIDEMREDLAIHNEQHEQDMKRALPVIEAYEAAMEDVNTARRGGKVVLWLAATITGIGGAYLVLRMIFFHH